MKAPHHPVHRRGPAALEGARRTALAALQGFRRTDRWAPARWGIVSAWAVLSLLTLVATCPGTGSGGRLGAEVAVDRDSIMGAQIMVRNDSSRIWEDVVLVLDGGYEYAQPPPSTMRPDDQIVVPLGVFRRQGDPSPPAALPGAVTIRCERGSERHELR